MRFFLIFTLLFSALCSAQDKVQTFAEAVAKAEGFYQKNTIPNRYRNPGDLKARRGEKYPGQVRVGKAGHIVFKSNADGWAALRHQIDKIITGESKLYTPDMSLKQVARRYAGNWRIWYKNVAHNLGVNPSITLAEYFEIPPVITPEHNPHALEGIL